MDLEGAPTTSRNPVERLRRRRYEDLDVILAQEKPIPAQVWGRYLDLLSMVGPEQIPLETHQAVLRKSTMTPAEWRKDVYRRLEAKKRPRSPHIHEARYQAVISNIREAGYQPEAEDYHFILEQFAAVGHHVGALQVLQELSHLKLQKTHKTYGLCLMALSHRLTLPIYHTERDRMVQTMTRICLKLVNDMWTNQVPITSFNVDLTLRVLKETMDFQAFQRLLRVAYGIDLAYPDRPPLEYWDKTATADNSASDVQNPPVQQPFSTSALNSTLDFLGRIGNISKLVQAFEVLTTPLPTHAVASPESPYADDADEDFGVNDPFITPYISPHAEPNTTSYQLMIKWLSRANCAPLARHYLLQVMEQDRLVDRHLRGECLLKGKGEILAPHLGITHYMFLSILGEANRNKDLEMLRFVLIKIRTALRRKRVDIEYYTEIQKMWRAEEDAAREGPRDAAPHVDPTLEVSSELAAKSQPSSAESTSAPVSLTAISSRRSSSASSSAPEPLIEVPYQPVPEPELAELFQYRREKIFDVDLHLAILQRDKTQIAQLERRALDTLGRTVQRVKEGLGRRIWSERDVYLRSVDRRTRLSRGTWREIVRFRATRAVTVREEELKVHSYRRPQGQQGHIAAQQGFFTPSDPSWAERLQRRSSPANATQDAVTATASSEIVPLADASSGPSVTTADVEKAAASATASS